TKVTFGDDSSAGASGTLAAAAGSTLTLSGRLVTNQNSQLIFGSSTATGTVVLSVVSPLLDTSASIEVAGGKLQVGNANNGANFSNFTQVAVDSGATLDLNDFNSTVGNLQGGGTVTTGVNAGTKLTLRAGSFSGVITGGGSVTKAGAGTMVLSGANDYTGGTTVSAGTLRLGGGGSLTKAGSGTLTLTHANTYTGGTVLNGGTLAVTSDGNLGNVSGGLTFG